MAIYAVTVYCDWLYVWKKYNNVKPAADYIHDLVCSVDERVRACVLRLRGRF